MKKKTNNGIKIFLAFLLAICISFLFYLRTERKKQAMTKNSATRLSSDICEIICPAGWNSERAGDSFRFSHPDTSFIIFDLSQDRKNIFSPLDISSTQIGMLASDILRKYGINKALVPGAISIEENNAIKTISFPFKLGADIENGVASIFYSWDFRFAYFASWTGNRESHNAKICASCFKFINLKAPYSNYSYLRPSMDSSVFPDISSIVKNAGDSYEQAKEILKSSEDNCANLLKAITIYQDAMSSVALTNSGGLVFDNANTLASDFRKTLFARIDKIERMKSEITQYIKLGDKQMAGALLDNMLATVSLENEISFRTWALKTKAEIKPEQEDK